MLGGNFGENEEMKKSIISDIKSFFGSVMVQKGMGGVQTQNQMMLPAKD